MPSPALLAPRRNMSCIAYLPIPEHNRRGVLLDPPAWCHCPWFGKIIGRLDAIELAGWLGEKTTVLELSGRDCDRVGCASLKKKNRAFLLTHLALSDCLWLSPMQGQDGDGWMVVVVVIVLAIAIASPIK